MTRKREKVADRLLGQPEATAPVAKLMRPKCKQPAVSKAALIGALNDLAEICRTVTPYVDGHGNAFYKAVDASGAIAAMTLVSKLTGALNEERAPAPRPGPGLIVQFIHGGDQKPVGMTVEQLPDDAIIIQKVTPHE